MSFLFLLWIKFAGFSFRSSIKKAFEVSNRYSLFSPLYSLYSNFTGGKAEKTTYDDGTTRISAQSDLGSVKLPKILDSLNIPIHDELKIRNYDVFLDKDENITSIDIYCKSNKDANEIIDWYKEKLNATDDRVKGEWNGFDMDVSYSEGSKLFSLSLKKQ